MPFFPDSSYGIAYLLALIFAASMTLLWGSLDARRLLLVLVLHWVMTRTIDVYDHMNFHLWIAQDFVFLIAMLIYVHGVVGRACASLFFVLLTFDCYSLVSNGSFEGAASVAETVGYLCMIIMVGGTDAGRGRLASFFHFAVHRSGSGIRYVVEWLSSQRRA